jgi:hypothetical protein
MADAVVVSASAAGTLGPTVTASNSDATTTAVPAEDDENSLAKESEENPEARALAQGLCCHIELLYIYSLVFIIRIVEFYFADANLPYDKCVLIHCQRITKFNPHR